MKSASPCPVVSQPMLGGVILSCIGLAVWFVPSSDELVSRLDRDGQTARVKQLAEERLSARAAAITFPQSDREKLLAWLDSGDPSMLNDAAIRADRKNMCAATGVPLELGRELVAHAGRIRRDEFDSLIGALVNRALGLGRPADAAALLDDWFRIHPSWEIARRQIHAWRWASRPEQALKALDTSLAAGLDASRMPTEFDDLRVQLALESDRPNLAFDIILKRHASARDEDKPAILSQLVDLANMGDRTTEAANLLARHLKTLAFHTYPLAEAIAMIRDGRAFSNEAAQTNYRRYAAAMARWQEWAGRGDVAYDTWLRLAVLGDEEAWGRVLELKEDLLLNDAFALVAADQIAHGKHLEAEPALADILLDEGRDDEAIQHYEAADARGRDALRARKMLGLIYQDAGEWARSLDEFDQALAIAPGDMDSRKGRAFALVRLRRYEDACQAWLTIARQAPNDQDAQETCAALCDSLGYHHECAEANRRLLATPGRLSTPDEHLDLAAQFHQIGEAAEEVAALRDGLGRFPESKDLRISLAESLSSQKDSHAEVMQLLADSRLRDDPDALALLIDEAADSAEAPTGIELFSGTVPPCLANRPEVQLKLALLFDRWGRAEQSDRIVSSLQKDARYLKTSVWHDLARVCLDAGDVARAEAFETQHLTTTGGRDSQSWELLGDIYTAEDRTVEATEAYKKAVQVLVPSAAIPRRHPPQITQAASQ